MIKFRFLEDVRTFKRGEVIELNSPNTILIGDNGCGKSTLLQLLWCNLPHDEYEIKTYETEYKQHLNKCVHLEQTRWEYKSIYELRDKVHIETDYQRVYICDSILKMRENMTNRVFGASRIDLQLGLAANNVSHGQITKLFYIKTTDEIIERREKEDFSGGKALLLIDEVEVGMSIKTQYKLPNSLLAVANDGRFDILASTHNIPIITDSRYNCFDVENRKYVKGLEYMESLKVPQRIGNK
jgi:predicted ATPase